MRQIVAFSAFTLLLALPACDLALKATGKPAPELAFDKVINAPVTKISGWKDLQGKVVVLEFFATWCEPCVENIPHLNKLQENLRGEDIVFITITDESEAVMEKFLKTNPIKNWVAFDPQKKVFNSFKVRGRPHTMIIDQNGIYVADTYPAFLQEKDLRLMLAGEKPEGWKVGEPEAPQEGSAGPPPLYEVRFGKAAGTKMRMSTGPGRYKAKSVTAAFLLERTLGLTSSRIIVEGPDAETKFDAVVRVPRDKHHRVYPLLKKAVLMGLDAKVVDETGLKGRYRVKLEPQGEDADAWKTVLKDRAGLAISPGRRKVRFVRIVPRKKKKKAKKSS